MKQNIPVFDYHIQSMDHGLNKPLLLEKTVEAAINRDLTAICFTDHFPFPPGFNDPTHDDRVSYPEYYKDAMRMERKYGNKIDVLIGAEVDWLSDYTEWIKRQTNKYDFDYLIGSVHYLKKIKDKYICHDFSRKIFFDALKYFGGIKKLTQIYYREVKKMVRSKLFDGVGHLDLIKKYNDGSVFDPNENWYREEVLKTLDMVAFSNMVMEINTAGWDRPCSEQYPSFWVIEEACKRNIPITIGSDAHIPNNVGKNLDKAVYLAKQAGYKKLTRFIKRKKAEIEI